MNCDQGQNFVPNKYLYQWIGTYTCIYIWYLVMTRQETGVDHFYIRGNQRQVADLPSI